MNRNRQLNRLTIFITAFLLYLSTLSCSNVKKVMDDDTEPLQNPTQQFAGEVVTAGDTETLAVKCGIKTCAEQEICCFATGDCYNPDTGECFVSSDSDTDTTTNSDSDSDVASSGAICYSNADCTSDEICFSDLCIGVGVCRPQSECAAKQIPPDPGEELASDPKYQLYLEYLTLVCGCDGRNYESECEAFSRGIRVPGLGLTGPCGGAVQASEFLGDPSYPSVYMDSDASGTERITCGGVENSCDDDRFCCPITFTCMPKGEEERCFVPETPGYPCTATFSDCHAYGLQVCQRPDCGEQGVCKDIVEYGDESYKCSEMSPVCGCDGVSYLNICFAEEEYQSVAYEGECL